VRKKFKLSLNKEIMGKHILKCECGREYDISEMFGRVVKEWLESGGRKIKTSKEKVKSIRERNKESSKKVRDALNRLRSRN